MYIWQTFQPIGWLTSFWPEHDAGTIGQPDETDIRLEHFFGALFSLSPHSLYAMHGSVTWYATFSVHANFICCCSPPQCASKK